MARTNQDQTKVLAPTPGAGSTERPAPMRIAATRPRPPLRAGIFGWHNGISGTAKVIDGDTIDLDGKRVRLEGIDAPELSQTCTDRAGATWRCGRAAKRALSKLVKGRTVRCRSKGRGKYGRMLGICSVGGRDINAALVRQGLAWAFVKYSSSYVGDEAKAKAGKIGIWQGKARPAWDYRSNRWALAEGDAPAGCAIKGNITRRGHIYHMPWSPWYNRVRIETGKGERWFCSETEAKRAGWRAVASR